MRKKHKFQVWGSVIPIDTKFRDASKAGVPLSELEPNSRGSQAYLKLLNFLMGIMDKSDKDEETRNHQSA
ncbi:MAG: chromosome partitioning protein [Oleispira sp.]|jgi:chromosome partitioning protein